ETNIFRLYGLNHTRAYRKDGFNDYIVGGRKDAVNPQAVGTKAGAHYVRTVKAGGSATVRLRLSDVQHSMPFSGFGGIMSTRKIEADLFYAEIQSGIKDRDARNIQRQAFAGMMWSKQYYYFDIAQWLKGDPGQPAPPSARLHGRNSSWNH